MRKWSADIVELWWSWKTLMQLQKDLSLLNYEHSFSRCGTVDVTEKNNILDHKSSVKTWDVSPLHLFSRLDTNTCLYVDYEQFNASVTSDRYPIVQIRDVILELQETTVFSKAYYHTSVTRKNISKTVVTIPLYEFLLMPFGLRSAV